MYTYAYICAFLYVYTHVKRKIEFAKSSQIRQLKTKEKRKRGYSSLILELQANKLIWKVKILNEKWNSILKVIFNMSF